MVIKGVYQDGSVVVELPGGVTRRVTTYILAAKQGHTPDNALHVGEKISWVDNTELTIQGIFENGDIAVSQDGPSPRDFRIPTSDFIIKEGQGRNGYSVGDTISYSTNNGIAVKGIVRAISRKNYILLLEMTEGLLFECMDCSYWQTKLATWAMDIKPQVIKN